MAGWKAVDWTIESLAQGYPEMLVMVSAKEDYERNRGYLQLTMKDFERWEYEMWLISSRLCRRVDKRLSAVVGLSGS